MNSHPYPTKTRWKNAFRLFAFLLFPICSIAQSNDGTTPTLLVSSTTCINTSGTLTGSTYVTFTGACGGGTPAGNRNDVWYRFVAKTPNPTITLSSAPAQRSIQLFSGSWGSLSSLQCNTSSNTLLASGLTVGTTYIIRIFSNNNTTGTFNICIVDPAPANDNCSGTPTPITSNLNCVTTAGNMYASTASATAITGCGTTPTYDIWYSFVAKAIDATVTLGSLGSEFTNPGLQLIASCGTPVTFACGTTTMNVTGLTPGTTYFVRIYSTGTAPTSPTNAGFTICVTHPANTSTPPNDECSGAITLQNNATCSDLTGTMMGATASAVPFAPCTGPVSYDVWYKFVATVTNPVITLSSSPLATNNFTGRALQLFSGNCGALTSIGCGTTSISPTLVVGNTYYIRVYSNSGLAAPVDDGYFRICVASPNMPIKFGNSYVNITKKTTGGVVEPGDVLEIRMTISHNNGTLYRMRYLDSVPTNTQINNGAGDRLRVISNEGVAVQNLTLATGDDAANYIANPGAGNYQIRMNLRFSGAAAGIPPNNTTTETTSATGVLVGGDVPKSGTTSSLFATAFRVTVTGVVGNTITLGQGKFIYRTSDAGPDITLTGTPYQILISQPMSLCVNATGVNMSQEYGGTFGSGSTLNRPTDLTSPIPGYTFINTSSIQGLGDGQYSIVKNISPRSGTNRLADRTPTCPNIASSNDACAQRMHGGHWDVDGDHTGTNNAAGNIPRAEGDPGGYMLMVNADFVASETYRQTITNLCPNTYYEFSAWFRNICPTCGVDYLTGSNYTPTRQPGVLPNLTFAMDGLDRYNTGEISYVDYNNGWIKKGFVFVTGSSQTQATFSIRNNSQGGGGNDWVMDDISVATCLPNMRYSPSLSPTTCQGSALTINDTIRSYFNNYRHHQWQRSTDNGFTWNNVSTLRDSTPVFNVAQNSWEYVTSYTISPSNTTVSDSGDLYRVIVATTSTNVGNTACQVTDGVSIINLAVIDCTPVLTTNLLTFNATLVDDKAVLNWTTSREDKNVKFLIERSTDGSNFVVAGTVNGHNNSGNTSNYYSFTDPVNVSGKVYYRVVMVDQDVKKKYTRVIQLNKQVAISFGFVNVINPFNQSLDFDITSPADTKAEAEILDMFGKVVKKTSYLVHKGTNTLSIFDTGYLPAGAYVFRITSNGQVISKKVLKKNNL